MTEYILGGGCFWCLDAVYRRIKGVREVISGYSGGETDMPDYYTVASGRTGHAEVVKIVFDETIVPPDVILDIFFTIHDPTTLNRQGADEGTQYRSIMLYADSAQKNAFKAALERAQNIWNSPIVTQVEPLATFYEAEPEHQDYFSNNPTNGYCYVVIEPKVVKARHAFTKWFKDE